MEPFLFGITYALVASLLFLFILLIFLRPWIRISPYIATHLDEFGKKCFRFKFYNCSLFSAHNIIVNLRQVEEANAYPKGKDQYYTDLKMTTPEIPVIPAYPIVRKGEFALHCIQLKTYEDLSAILGQKGKTLELRVILRHGLTGLSRNFVKEFKISKFIVEGEFKFGTSLAIE